MNLQNDHVIGIVGGMGPHSGLELYKEILDNIKADKDQDYLSIVLASYSKHIPDRTDYLQGNCLLNPADNIIEIIKNLHMVGAKTIAMACNTVYSPKIYKEILNGTSHLNVRILNMPYEVALYIKKNYPMVEKVGLMTTNGTYLSKVYSDILINMGIEPIIPDYKFQNEVVHQIIYDSDFGIKSKPRPITNEVYNLLNKVELYFQEKQADLILLGCTELSLLDVRGFNHFGHKIIDSTKVFAKSVVTKI
jgi:aspartate racemase